MQAPIAEPQLQTRLGLGPASGSRRQDRQQPGLGRLGALQLVHHAGPFGPSPSRHDRSSREVSDIAGTATRRPRCQLYSPGSPTGAGGADSVGASAAGGGAAAAGMATSVASGRNRAAIFSARAVG